MDTDTQNTDPHIHLNSQNISVNPPYLKLPELKINDHGLRIKKHYTTANVCKVLKIKPDAFRYRIRTGFYPEMQKIAGKRIFAKEQIKELIRITKKLF